MPDYHSGAGYAVAAAVVEQQQFAYYKRGYGYRVEKHCDAGLFP